MPRVPEILDLMGSFSLGDVNRYGQVIFDVTIVNHSTHFLSSGMGTAPIPDDKKHLY